MREREEGRSSKQDKDCSCERERERETKRREAYSFFMSGWRGGGLTGSSAIHTFHINTHTTTQELHLDQQQHQQQQHQRRQRRWRRQETKRQTDRERRVVEGVDLYCLTRDRKEEKDRRRDRQEERQTGLQQLHRLSVLSCVV